MDNNLPTRLQAATQTPPFKIAALYALFGALWILFSDKLLALVVHDRATITRISLFKGWIFIAVTAWLLYRLIRRDYRQLRDAGDLIRQNEELLRAIADAAADSIILIDDRMRVTYWNSAGERVFGYSREEAMGKEIDFIVPERYREEKGTAYRRFAATGEGKLIGKTREFSALRRDGTEFPIDLSISRVRLMGTWHAVGIIRDISERINLEGQLRHAQKMEAIGTLTGGIAHDFNNSLTAIIGFGSLARMNLAKGDPMVAYMDNILTAADRAADLTRSLLAFSRSQPLETKQVNLHEVIRGAEKLLTRLLREDIELRIEMPEAPLVVLADAGQIIQILVNLAANSENAMPHGGRVMIGAVQRTIEEEFVRVHGYGKPGSYALLSFSDTGTGMDEETRQRIFEPFFTTKGVGKGPGLGLSSVYGIVKQHNGYINCYSEPGLGTTFRIYLPSADAQAEQSAVSAQPGASGGTETILLAEDDVMVRGLVSGMLCENGYKVIEAVDGEDAVAKFREHMDSIQLLILDVIMPKKNGRQAYEEIRGIRPGIRAIFTSGYPAEVFWKEGSFEEGINFISKPVSPNDLLQKIRMVMDGG